MMNAPTSALRGAVTAPRNGKDLPTVCVLCSHNCGLRVDVADGRITDVRADERNPVTQGYVCNKAFSIPHYVDHTQRTEHPMKRRADGSFERIGWDRAIRETGGQLRDIRRLHTPRSIALVGVGGQGNHLDGAYAISFLKALGSPWWFNALAQEKTQHPLVDGWMFGAPPSSFFHPDLEHTDYVLMLGTNPLMSNRGHNAREFVKQLADDPDRKLVVVAPRRTETARRARADAGALLGFPASAPSAAKRRSSRAIAPTVVIFSRVEPSPRMDRREAAWKTTDRPRMSVCRGEGITLSRA